MTKDNVDSSSEVLALDDPRTPHILAARRFKDMQADGDPASIGRATTLATQYLDALPADQKPFATRVMCFRASCLAKMRLVDLAITEYQQIQRDYNYAPAFTACGHLYIGKGNIREAEKLFRAALTADGFDKKGAAVAYNGLGYVCLLTTRLEESEQYYRKTLEFDANSTQAINGIASSLLRKPADAKISMANAQEAEAMLIERYKQDEQKGIENINPKTAILIGLATLTTGNTEWRRKVTPIIAVTAKDNYGKRILKRILAMDPDMSEQVFRLLIQRGAIKGSFNKETKLNLSVLAAQYFGTEEKSGAKDAGDLSIAELALEVIAASDTQAATGAGARGRNGSSTRKK